MAQVPEMAITKKTKVPTTSQELEQNKTPALDEDIIFDILVRLPAHLVHELRYVCKPWIKLIRNPIFIDTHLMRSEPGLLLARRTVETQFIAMEEEKFILQNLNFRCSKAWITASCNGLLLLRDVQTRELLYIANPITKKSETLPLVSVNRRHFIGFDFTFIPATKEYKVVRLTVDFRRKVPVYEILALGSHTWKWVEGPRFRGSEYSYSFHLSLIKGFLHWGALFVDKDGSKYTFSLDMTEEKCLKMSLPNWKLHNDGNNKFLEMDGFISLINQGESSPTHIDIWVLKDFNGGHWVKQHCIVMEFLRNKVNPFIRPVACLRNGKVIIFRRLDYDDSSFHCFQCYSCDLELGQTWSWDLRLTPDHECLVHVNSLKWWKESY